VAELGGDVAPKERGAVQRGWIERDRTRRPRALDLDLIDDGDVHRERHRVHERERQRLPL